LQNTDVAVAGVVYAEANWGRWVGRCNGRYCFSAMQLTRFQPVFRCADCGTGADVVWPPFVEDAERLLMMRPDPRTRNWLPGEDLHDLLAENMVHGVLADALEGHPGGPVMAIVGDRITHNALPSARESLAIGGQ
jgi:hypothetical protein